MHLSGSKVGITLQDLIDRTPLLVVPGYEADRNTGACDDSPASARISFMLNVGVRDFPCN